MLAFALKLSRTPEQVCDTDYAELKQHGFDDEDILDIAGVTAFFGLSNRMAIVTAMQANEEFYTFGRKPR
jgi:4-carboxymuconolactone decarboxylase